MKAILLCAGKGTRLAPLTDTMPKVMLPLDSTPLLGHTLEWLAHHGIEQVAINLHHLSDVITEYVGDGQQWRLRVTYFQEDELLGTAGALLPMREWIGDDEFVVIYGDKYCQFDLAGLIRAHNHSDARMTIAVHHTDRPKGAGLVDPSDYTDGRGVILRYEEKPPDAFSQWANTGIYVCEPWVLQYIPDAPCDWGHDVIPDLVRQAVVYAEPIQGLAMDIGTSERYEQAQKLASRPGAIFIDRDGTINEGGPHGQYVLTREAFHFLSGALDALAFLSKNSERRIAVLTNQPALGKGLLTQAGLDDIHDWMERCVVHAGGRIDEVYVCPHTPDEGCGCRKPKPGLFIQAAHDLGIDLSKSVMVGDTKYDLQAAWAAGIEECYLVLTGDPRDKWPDTWHGQRTYEIVATLGDAARLIVEREKSNDH